MDTCKIPGLHVVNGLIYTQSFKFPVLESIVLLSCSVNADLILFDFHWLLLVSASSSSVCEGVNLNKIFWKEFVKSSSYVLDMKRHS